MKKYKILLVIIFLGVYLLGSYFNYESLRKEKKVFLSDLNISIVDMHQKLFDNNELMYNADYTFWDMGKSRILKNREKQAAFLKNMDQHNEQSIKKTLDLKKRVICLDKVCWEFLGILTINNETIVTLLSKGKKVKLQNFHVNDMLLTNVKITSIDNDSMHLIDLDKNKKLTLKLFDVDVEKYRPKGKK